MSARTGSAFLDKVRSLLSKENGKPVLKPKRTLALKDFVENRKPKKGEATCITEMYILMACWKKNNFVDVVCSSEISNFYTCVKKVQAMKNQPEKRNVQGGLLPPQQATVLLKRYPNLRTEI